MKLMIKQWAKTIAAFVATLAGNVLVSLFTTGVAWPQTKAEWIQYAVTTIGATLAVGGTRNKITQDQINKDPNVIGGVVVTTPPPLAVPTAYVPPVAGGYTNPFRQ